MILADKIIRLRKKSGWSQEELADKMNVSRQAVSKWEAAQSTPDLEKILQLSKLFGVTTDYLLKDEIEDEEFTDITDDTPLRRFTLKEANDFLELRERASLRIAVATFLCILSVIPLLLLVGLSTLTDAPVSEKAAVCIGVISIFVLVAIAVAIYIGEGFKSAPYEFLEKEPFESEYGVEGFVKERKKLYRPTYVRFNILGACICILSPVPLICTTFAENELLAVLMLCVTVATVAVGVIFFVTAGVRWASMQKILGEGEYSRKGKINETVSTVYWLVATAIYLGWSFLTGDWHITWVIWPITAIMSSVVELICNLVVKNKD